MSIEQFDNTTKKSTDPNTLNLQISFEYAQQGLGTKDLLELYSTLCQFDVQLYTTLAIGRDVEYSDWRSLPGLSTIQPRKQSEIMQMSIRNYLNNVVITDSSNLNKITCKIVSVNRERSINDPWLYRITVKDSRSKESDVFFGVNAAVLSIASCVDSFLDD